MVTDHRISDNRGGNAAMDEKYTAIWTGRGLKLLCMERKLLPEMYGTKDHTGRSSYSGIFS